jgi:hypothetical protein
MQDTSAVATAAVTSASTLQLTGAFCFGVLLGWLLYFINRYRTSDVQIGDLAAVLGVIGGGAVLSLFEAKTDLFGAYGIGLLVGFLAYLLVLCVMVAKSPNFTVDWFLDGRRKVLAGDEIIGPGTRPTSGAMIAEGRKPQ